MKILHTSDWHLGQSLFNHKRYEECAAFLSWLGDLIEGEDIQALLVAGDIFDNSAPSHRAQELYYRFLCRIAQSSCRHVVIIAGNHDSPSFLNAPREVLRFLNVHVIGSIGAQQAKNLTLFNRKAQPINNGFTIIPKRNILAFQKIHILTSLHPW
jgi:exonuclease SbcD